MSSADHFGQPRRTGFYAGAFEKAQRDSSPMYAVAFRRTEQSIVEIFKLDSQEQAASVMSMLITEGVRYEDMWPIVIVVGKIDEVSVRVKMPTLDEVMGKVKP